MAHVPTATEMLMGIPSDTAQQLFNAVLYQTDPPGSTMLPALDEFILENRQGVAAGNPSLNRGDVIEVQGPAASGKTQLLYHLTACCILPKEVQVMSADGRAECTVHLGGWCRSAVVFDCEGRWDTRRLHAILVTRLNLLYSKTRLPPLPYKSDSTVSVIALQSLSRLHVFRPTSSFQLVATLMNLPKYHAEKMQNEEMRLLLVDSISSFYWIDRWQAERSDSKKSSRPNPLKHVLRCLQDMRRSHGPVIVLTNWGLNPLSSASVSSTPFFKQHLTAPYPAPFDTPPRPSSEHPDQLTLNYHITLPFPFVCQLHPDLIGSDGDLGHEGGMLARALRDERRQEVVRRGEIGGFVRIPHAGRGQDGNAIGRFGFRVLGHDVLSAPK